MPKPAIDPTTEVETCPFCGSPVQDPSVEPLLSRNQVALSFVACCQRMKDALYGILSRHASINVKEYG